MPELTEFQRANFRSHFHTGEQVRDASSGEVSSGGLSEAEVQALIDDAIEALTTGAPGALDTLNELAAALGDDANFAASMTTALAAKAASSHSHVDGDLPAGLARDSEVTTALTAKADTSHSHVDGDLPAGLARDSEVTSAISTHAATPHGGLSHAYVGRNAIGGSWLTMIGARHYMRKVTLASAGLLSSISAYYRHVSLDLDDIKFSLYTDIAGDPGRLIGFTYLGEKPDYGSINMGTTARWIHSPIGVWLTAGDYWIAASHWKSENNIAQIAYDATGGGGRYFTTTTNNSGYSGEPPDNSVTTTSEDYSIRASVLT